ncbi:MAG TPA: STM3941 family protein [Steroidobacteraceae bacterium]|nr:STM3941 family protein [Steroidobacteraceae bacterium]
MNDNDLRAELTRPPRPGFRDWAVLAISVTFVVIACVIASRSPRDALVGFTFFGVCALVSGYTVYRKLRRSRFTATNVLAPGGVELRGSNSRILMLAVLIAAPGAAILLYGDAPLVIRICGWSMVVLAAGLVMLVLSGRFSRLFIRFDPLGITLGQSSFEYVVPWDELTDIHEFEMHDNPVVGFDVRQPELMRVTPESARPRLYKLMARNKTFSGRDVVIMPMHFATSAELLCAALRNYSANRDARAQLVRRPALT